MNNIEILFWNMVKESGKNCDNINNIRKQYKKKYDQTTIQSIDSMFNKYYTMIWAKLEPTFGNFYDEDSTGFRNFVFYITLLTTSG